MNDVPTPHFKPEDCVHMNFNAHCKVGRLQKSDLEPEVIVAYSMDVRVTCRDCGLPFEFAGLPLGFSHYRPTVSIDAQEMRVPLVPLGGKPTEGLAGFSVTMQSFEPKPEVTQ